MSVYWMPKAFGEPVSEVMAGSGLQSFAVVHQRFDGVGGFRSGKFFLVGFAPFDYRDGQHFLTEIRVDVEHLDGPLLCLLGGGMGGVAFLPQEFPGAEEGTGGLLPSHHGTPLIEHFGKISVGVNFPGVEITEQSLGGGAHAEPFLQRFQSSLGNPGHFRGKSLYVVFFFLKQALRDKHGKIYILHTCLLKPSVQFALDIFPDGVACGLDYHAALDAGIVDEVRFQHHIGIPLGEVVLHGGDSLHQFLFLCHDFLPPQLNIAAGGAARTNRKALTADPSQGTDGKRSVVPPYLAVRKDSSLISP